MSAMGMEAWQNQQRAQKQKDRQNKNQSAEILHNFRGGIKEEDELLKKIREQDQQKKKEAQDNLASFRANDIEAKSPTKSPEKYDGPLPEMAPMKDDPGTTIAAGAVSSIAANFAGTGTPIEASAMGDTSTKGFAATTTNTSAVDAPAENGAVTLISPDQIELNTSNSQSTTDSGHGWVQITSDEVPEATTTTNGTTTASAGVTAKAKEEQPTAFARLDVDFSFGLISTRTSPSFDGYMEGVAEVVTSAINESNGDMKQHMSYDPRNTPFVEKISKDDSYVDAGGRGNVQRLLVRAVVPISHGGPVSARKARSFIIKALAAALRQGYFIQIAEREF